MTIRSALALLVLLAARPIASTITLGPARTPLPMTMSGAALGIGTAGNGRIIQDDFRLSVVTGSPVVFNAVAPQPTLYLTPYTGQQITVFDINGYATTLTSGEISIPVPAVANQMYDVFVYNNGGVAKLEAIAWASDSTRAVSLLRCPANCHDANGVLTKGADFHLFVGSFRTLGSGTTEDSLSNRLVYNYYNRVTRNVRIFDANQSGYTYTTNQFRPERGGGTQMGIVQGMQEGVLSLILQAYAGNPSATTGAGVFASVAFGVDSTTTPFDNAIALTAPLPTVAPLTCYLSAPLQPGYHVITPLETGNGVGTTTWSPATGGPFGGSAGILNTWMMFGSWTN